jgi:hypothetical protein
MPSQVRPVLSVETILPPHKVQTLVTTARTIDQERWEVSALRFPSWILDNCLLSEKQVLPESRILPILGRYLLFCQYYCLYVVYTLTFFSIVSGRKRTIARKPP